MRGICCDIMGESMAEIICPECEAEVAASAEACPECGFPLESLKQECPHCHQAVLFSGEACPECGEPSIEADPEEPAAAAVEDAEQGPDAAVDESEREAAPVGVDEAEVAVAAISAGDEPLTGTGAGSGALPVAGGEGASAGEAVEAAAEGAPAEGAQGAAGAAIDNAFVLNYLVNYINQVRNDLVNNPIKYFAQILAELDSSNKELFKNVTEQNEKILAALQETGATMADRTARILEQNDEGVRKSQELTLTVISELTSATSGLKEANSSALAELKGAIKQLPPPQSAPAAAPAAPVAAPPAPASQSDTMDYILYCCLAMLLFTVFNLFITIYAVRLLKP